MGPRRLVLASTLGLLLAVATAAAAPVIVERAVVRFVAPETGGVRSPRFILERDLAFEARIEALADPEPGIETDTPYRERHVRAALERHVAETLLASSRIDPPPTEVELADMTRVARAMLRDRVGGEGPLRAAAAAEQRGEPALLRIARRQARASLYVDRMVAPMLEPTEVELRAAHRQTQFRALSFEEARPALRRWVVARRLGAAVAAHFLAARSRLTLTVLTASP